MFCLLCRGPGFPFETGSACYAGDHFCQIRDHHFMRKIETAMLQNICRNDMVGQINLIVMWLVSPGSPGEAGATLTPLQKTQCRVCLRFFPPLCVAS